MKRRNVPLGNITLHEEQPDYYGITAEEIVVAKRTREVLDQMVARDIAHPDFKASHGLSPESSALWRARAIVSYRSDSPKNNLSLDAMDKYEFMIEEAYAENSLRSSEVSDGANQLNPAPKEDLTT